MWGRITILAAIVVSLPQGALALEPHVLDERGSVSVGTSLEYLEDPDGALSLDEARQQMFAPAAETPNFGFDASVYWFRFALRNPGEEPVLRTLEIGYAPIDHLSIWVEQPSGGFARHDAGDALPFSARALDHRVWLLPITTAPGQLQQVYVRVDTESSVQVPMTLWRPEALLEHDHRRQMLLGIFYGALLIMGLYNLFLYFAVRDRSYLFYVAYVFSFMGVQAQIDGLGYQFLWPDAPGWNGVALILFLNLVIITAGQFGRAFLDLRHTVPVMDRVLQVCVWIATGLMVVALVAPYGISVRLSAGFSSLAAVADLVAGILAWRAGLRSARFFVLAWATFLLGTVTLVVGKFGLLPLNYFVENGQQIGALLEVWLLSFALADRINMIKSEKEQAQRRALALQTETAASLQREVDRQTEELRRKNEELEAQAQRVREADEHKTHFFQNVSHELRTPLTLILTPLDQLRTDPRLADDRRVDMASKNARRLLRLVNQLLDFQKLSAGRRELTLRPVDLVPFTRACAEYVLEPCRQRGIAFRVRIGGVVADGADLGGRPVVGEPVLVHGEIDALEKVVFNYLSNALKFTPDGGDIELALDTRATEEGERVRIAVIDSGPGIAEEDQARLFHVFTQVAGEDGPAHGTGLGLALAKELAEQMGGSVGLTSSPGRGSRFWVELPRVSLSDDDACGTESTLDRRGVSREPYELTVDVPLPGADTLPDIGATLGEEDYVLVVDDLADMRELVCESLRAAGYVAVPAASGKQALARARAVRPALIVCDWMMPEMTGPEVIAALRGEAELAAVPVVLLTAKSDEEARLMGAKVGADAFLGKPFNDEELRSVVRNMLSLKQRERQVEKLNRHLSENVLKRYLPPSIVDDIVAGNLAFEREPRKLAVTVLFADLVGFTSMTERLRAGRMARLLNQYLAEMSETLFLHGGTIDKFIGDAVMAMFGAPVQAHADDQVRRAVACARDMHRAMERLSAEWAREGIEAAHIRIGVHHGPAVVGVFGGAARADYTVIGPTVNMASRLQSIAGAGETFLSGEVYDYLAESAAEPAGRYALRGIGDDILVYRLVDEEERRTMRVV